MKLAKSMDWFLYDSGLRHERVNTKHSQQENCVVAHSNINCIFLSSPKLSFLNCLQCPCYLHFQHQENVQNRQKFQLHQCQILMIHHFDKINIQFKATICLILELPT